MKINVISFTIPYPADYGGVIDVFYKIKSLHSKGIGVILHCFEYNRLPASQLEKYCDKVYYYNRNTSVLNHLLPDPYIVVSRRNPELKLNLLKNEYPILFEGIHCTGYLCNINLKKRLKIVRMHNIESEYYFGMFRSATSLLQRTFFWLEAYKLKRYERKLNCADQILTISTPEYQKLKISYKDKVKLINAFHAFDGQSCADGKGYYLLYHGDLSIAGNLKSIRMIVDEYNKVNCPLPLYIAGLNPPSDLIELVDQVDNLYLISNPSDNEIADLIRHAHINLIISTNHAGMKLKLIHALLLGRFCLVNEEAVIGSEFAECCEVITEIGALNDCIMNLMDKDFFKHDHEKRYHLLESQFSNEKNALKIIKLLSMPGKD